MKSGLVREGYDRVADKYLSQREQLHSDKYIRKLLKHLIPKSHILDLGCGAGLPVDDILLDNGHGVIGLDISEKMISLARRNCPGGHYEIRDIATLEREEYVVDAVVCLYALFHLDRSLHRRWLTIVRSFLTPGGMLLISMGDKDYEGTTDFYGTPMWWSQWGPVKNREIVVKAGFEIIIDEIDHSGSENHQILLARAT